VLHFKILDIERIFFKNLVLFNDFNDFCPSSKFRRLKNNIRRLIFDAFIMIYDEIMRNFVFQT